jgi:hypothetical protein
LLELPRMSSAQKTLIAKKNSAKKNDALAMGGC